ncbi:BTB/POZ domain-containing protein At1g04390 [Silene latifolia]|uniref:BTB/POZ domain-containing protein At1g04390 n=1 Tax=Silene latifolia TaxID=37657 RepID=UPI003D7744D1
MKVTRKERKERVSNHDEQLSSLHQRLYQSLNLGFRYCDGKEKEWYTNDIELQRLVLRSLSAFLLHINPQSCHFPFVKDSVADIVKAIASILQSPNDFVLTMASQLVSKLTSILPASLLDPHVVRLTQPLSSLLSNHQSQVAIMTATALNLILSKLSHKKENEISQILEKHNVVAQLIANLKILYDKIKPIEYFVEMSSLLSSVMKIWPHTRYPVWSDTKLTQVIQLFCCKPESSVRLAVLQLYFAIALCGYGAHKLVDSGELLVNTIVNCMGESQPQSVRILAFKVAQRLTACEDLCLKVLSFSSKPVVEAIISAMNCSSTHHRKVSSSDLCLVMEACRLALITRWPGRHHGYLWRLGVHKYLLNLLMPDFLNVHPHNQSLSIEGLISVAREGLNINFLLDLRPYIWEIFGSLLAQCDEDFNPSKNGNEICIRVLITSACLSFQDSISRERLLHRANRECTLSSISAAKAVLMMMYSPCEYIAFHARLMLSEVLRLEGEEQLKHLLKDLQFIGSEVTSMPDRHQILISIMGLVCYSGLPQFYTCVVKYKGVKALLAFVRWWLRNEAHFEGVSLSSHVRDTTKLRLCCMIDIVDWEGKEIHLFLALWSLAELINRHEAEGGSIDIFAWETTYGKESFIHDIHDICARTSSSGLRWYSSYLLSLFGIYGFPSKLGKKVSSLFCEKDYGDMYLVLRDGKSIGVHKVVLLVRCPSFLPPDETSNSFPEDQVMDKIQKTKREVTLSAHVDEQAIFKVLDFVYSGCLNAEGELVRKAKVLAKHCNIQPLLHLLCKKRPKWGAAVPNFDLTSALGPAGRDYSDVILEATSKEDTGSSTNCCSFPRPHIHSHKAILMSSCKYVWALFQSGMQESRSETLKIPVSWEALYKFVVWAYSGDVPRPLSGCMWDNMDIETKMLELRPYIELCWLAEFWFIDDLGNECSQVVASFLDSPELSLKLIQFAASFSQWEIVNIAANRIASIYGNLRCSSALDVLDEGLVELIRLASVRLSQE